MPGIYLLASLLAVGVTTPSEEVPQAAIPSLEQAMAACSLHSTDLPLIGQASAQGSKLVIQQESRRIPAAVTGILPDAFVNRTYAQLEGAAIPIWLVSASSPIPVCTIVAWPQDHASMKAWLTDPLTFAGWRPWKAAEFKDANISARALRLRAPDGRTFGVIISAPLDPSIHSSGFVTLQYAPAPDISE